MINKTIKKYGITYHTQIKQKLFSINDIGIF